MHFLYTNRFILCVEFWRLLDCVFCCAAVAGGLRVAGMADAVAFRAGGGRRKVQEVQKTKEEITELAKALVRFGKAIDVLARRGMRRQP